MCSTVRVMRQWLHLLDPCLTSSILSRHVAGAVVRLCSQIGDWQVQAKQRILDHVAQAGTSGLSNIVKSDEVFMDSVIRVHISHTYGFLFQPLDVLCPVHDHSKLADVAADTS